MVVVRLRLPRVVDTFFRDVQRGLCVFGAGWDAVLVRRTARNVLIAIESFFQLRESSL